MDKWIHNVVANNIRKGKITENEAELYEYGYTLMVEKMLIFVICVVIALLLDAVWEVLALCITFIPLRVYSGGYHAKSRWGCMVLSGMFVILGIIGIRVLSRSISVSAYLFIEIVCIIVTMRFVPVDIKQKPITAGEKNYYRKKVMCVVCSELLVGLICIHFEIYTTVLGIIVSSVFNMLSALGQVFCNNFMKNKVCFNSD